MPIDRRRFRAIRSPLFVALALAALPAAGQGFDRIASFTVGVPEFSDRSPDLAVQPGGSFLMIWQRNRLDFNFKTHAQRFDAAGRPLAPSVELWGGLGPQVVALPDGGFVATSGFEGSAAPEIRLHRLDGLGRPLGDPVVVAFYPGANFSDLGPSLAVAPSGSVAVVWLDPNKVLRGRFFNASLRPISEAIFLSNPVPSVQIEFNPELAFQADGTALVVWVRLNEQSALQIFGKRFSATGQPLSEAFPISQPEPLQIDTNPRVIALAAGGWWAGWLRRPPIPPFPEVLLADPWVVRLGADGTPLNAEQSLGVPDGSGGFALGTDPTDRLLVLGMNAGSVSGRIFGREGNTPSDLFTLPGDGSSLEPVIADRSPGFIAAWSNYAPGLLSTADLLGMILVPPCLEGKTAVCLGPEGRYAVEIAWQNGAQTGTAKPLPLSGNVATFGLRNAAEHDVTVLLSGPGSRDLTFAATTGAALAIRVTDKTTGAVQTFSKPAGRFASRRIPNALPLASPGAEVATAASWAADLADPAPVPSLGETCVPTSRALCLLGARFRAELLAGPNPRPALAILRTDKSGAFAFPSAAENPIVTLTMTDGRASNGKFWVYLGGLSAAGYKVKITDLSTGVTRTYSNPVGKLESRADRAAF